MLFFFFFFFFNDTATTEIYTLSLHDALPISSAQQPGQQCRGRDETHGHPDPARRKDERRRSDDRGAEEQPLAPARDSRPAEERRERGGEADETTCERNRPQRSRRSGHPALPQSPVDAGKGPVALAHDDHPVGARHPAEPRHGQREIALLELPEDGSPVHLAMIALTRPPGKCRAAHSQRVFGPTVLPVPAREEAEQREHEDHDEDDPENAHALISSLFRVDVLDTSP